MQISLEGSKGLEGAYQGPWGIKTEIKTDPLDNQSNSDGFHSADSFPNSPESGESDAISTSNNMFYGTSSSDNRLHQQLTAQPHTQNSDMSAFLKIAQYMELQRYYQYQSAVAQYNSQNYSNTMNSSSLRDAAPQMSDFVKYQKPIFPTPNNSQTSIVSDTSRLSETPPTSRISGTNASPVPCRTPTSQYDAANAQPQSLTPSRSMTSTPKSSDSVKTESKALEESDTSSLCGSDYSSNEDKLDQNHNDNNDYNKPAFNSHGKEKIYKCKICSISFNIKQEFWEHSRMHIKKQKLLECVECPFVTEFKHHLEYHVRSKHSKEKPFKCDKCDYRCVNKSMLMSHFKSHSSIYQFRCMDCDHVAKYLHSMKQHLQRKQHRPAMVLNEDGTPNPLPIIDVYGRKRGPKPKKIPKEIIMEKQVPVFTSPPFTMGSFAVPVISSQLQTSTPKLNTLLPTPSTSLQGLQQAFVMANLGAELSNVEKNFSTPVKSTNWRDTPLINKPDNTHADEFNAGVRNEILDLSVKEKDNILPITIPQVTPSTPATESKRNRRKGKAVKLKIAQEEPESMDVEFESEDFPESEDIPTDRFTQTQCTKAISMEVEDSSSKPDSVCDHCQISFKDEVLYELHMEYHSTEDPLTCKLCGESYKDVRSFNVHLARNRH